MYPMSPARVIGTTARCHQLKVTSVTGLPDRAAAAQLGCRNRRRASHAPHAPFPSSAAPSARSSPAAYGSDGTLLLPQRHRWNIAVVCRGRRGGPGPPGRGWRGGPGPPGRGWRGGPKLAGRVRLTGRPGVAGGEAGGASAADGARAADGAHSRATAGADTAPACQARQPHDGGQPPEQTKSAAALGKLPGPGGARWPADPCDGTPRIIRVGPSSIKGTQDFSSAKPPARAANFRRQSCDADRANEMYRVFVGHGED